MALSFLVKIEELEAGERKEQVAVEALAVVKEENASLKEELGRLRAVQPGGRAEG